MQITKRTKIIWGILLLLLVGAGGGLWWTRQTPPPPVMPAPKAPSPKTPKIPRAEKAPAAMPVKSSAAPASGSSAVPVSLTAGNLGRLTDLKGELEELRIEVQLEELRAKKKSLLNPAPVAAPPVRVPELTLPAMTPPKSPPASSLELPPVRRAGTAVVSVRGVDGDVSALIRTGSGTVTVRKGSRFGGGVVTSVSRQAVVVSRNGKTAVLPFE